MRAVVQRVKKAGVQVGEERVGSIAHGLLLFLGVGKEDGEADLEWLMDKIVGLRIFEDDEGKMNRSVTEVGGSILVVSQFTLYGDCRRGKRPSFSDAAPPEDGNFWYERAISNLQERGIPVQTGIFQASMEVELINDGPVTILLDSKKIF